MSGTTGGLMLTPAVKFTQLMQKALSTHSEEEARTCAMTALRLLDGYDFVVVDRTQLLAIDRKLKELKRQLEILIERGAK
jgi:hypothetical protein